MLLNVGGDVALREALYLILDKNSSRSHILPYSLTDRRMAVCVYDIESDGTLASGVGYPAVNRELVTSGITGGM